MIVFRNRGTTTTTIGLRGGRSTIPLRWPSIALRRRWPSILNRSRCSSVELRLLYWCLSLVFNDIHEGSYKCQARQCKSAPRQSDDCISPVVQVISRGKIVCLRNLSLIDARSSGPAGHQQEESDDKWNGASWTFVAHCQEEDEQEKECSQRGHCPVEGAQIAALGAAHPAQQTVILVDNILPAPVSRDISPKFVIDDDADCHCETDLYMENRDGVRY